MAVENYFVDNNKNDNSDDNDDDDDGDDDSYCSNNGNTELYFHPYIVSWTLGTVSKHLRMWISNLGTAGKLHFFRLSLVVGNS